MTGAAGHPGTSVPEPARVMQQPLKPARHGNAALGAVMRRGSGAGAWRGCGGLRTRRAKPPASTRGPGGRVQRAAESAWCGARPRPRPRHQTPCCGTPDSAKAAIAQPPLRTRGAIIAGILTGRERFLNRSPTAAIAGWYTQTPRRRASAAAKPAGPARSEPGAEGEAGATGASPRGGRSDACAGPRRSWQLDDPRQHR